jgi:hypothetical protein
VYAVQPPESSAYSTEATPEPASVAVTVTTAVPSASVRTVAEVTGGVVSGWGGATTVKLAICSAEVLPATSVARKCTMCAPTVFTTTGAVYAVKAPPSTLYSMRATPDPESVAVIVTVAVPM